MDRVRKITKNYLVSKRIQKKCLNNLAFYTYRSTISCLDNYHSCLFFLNNQDTKDDQYGCYLALSYGN